MKKLQLPGSVTRAVNKGLFQLKKHSPEICVGVGLVCGAASMVLACKATTKINPVLEETKKNVDYIHDGVEKGEVKAQLENGEVGLVPYSEEDGKKDLTIVYAQAGLKFIKLYAPAAILGATSVYLILKGHNILTKRNTALAAAYASEHLGFKEYRGRVIERFGEQLDRELKYNIKTQEIEETVINEDGTEQTVKKTVEVVDPNHHSPYARFFDETCLGWERNAEYNLTFLRHVQNWCNDKLKSQGFLTLNEVYEQLGIQKTKAGNVVGWVYDEKNPVGDNFVDFFIYDVHNPNKRAFVNGLEKSILLDFNVDGNIMDLMK